MILHTDEHKYSYKYGIPYSVNDRIDAGSRFNAGLGVRRVKKANSVEGFGFLNSQYKEGTIVNKNKKPCLHQSNTTFPFKISSLTKANSK